ncbi:MAG: hypothetical protein M1457_01540 [bacterium]|nr:hypothetical protein [bacterium]
MAADRMAQAEWLEWSGLPAALNALRMGAWSVFRKLVDLDCAANRFPGTVEVSADERARRCGLASEAVVRILELLRRKHYVRAFIPEQSGEAGLYEIAVPLATPLAADAVAAAARDPHLGAPSAWRYLRPADAAPADPDGMREVIDLYLNHMSSSLNTFDVEQIELAVRRFPLEAIRETIRRAAEHRIRAMSWVVKDLIRAQAKATAEKHIRNK